MERVQFKAVFKRVRKRCVLSTDDDVW